MIEIQNILETNRYIDGLEAVIFDLDDTLYSEKEYELSGFRAVAALFPQVNGLLEELIEANNQNKLAIDSALDKFGMISEKEKALHTYRFHLPSICLYPGVKKMLQQIHREKRIGLITDGRPEGQRAKLKALGLFDLVDEIVITDELGGIQFRKPNDAAYRLIAGQLQVPFEKMGYVGNDRYKDFVAPELLGMRCIWFNNRDGLYADNYGRLELLEK